MKKCACGNEGKICVYWSTDGTEKWECETCRYEKTMVVKCLDGEYRTLKELREMERMENQVKDGIALMYIKDGEMYPCVLTEEQYTVLTIMVSSICNPLNVAYSKPQGKAVNLTGGMK